MKKDDSTAILAEEIFQTLVSIPVKGGMTQLQVSAVRDASERYAQMSDAETFLKNIKALMENPEEILRRAQTAGDLDVYNQIKAGVDRLQNYGIAQ
jgi:hypothetical protein